MAKTGIVQDIRYMDHNAGDWHPESPDRLRVIYQMLEQADIKGRLTNVTVRRAEMDELTQVHLPDYVGLVASTHGKSFCRLDPDTATSPGSYEAALLAAGGLCEAVAMVLKGELENAFALVRPPGHHAEAGRAMGFCLFNNVAVASRYAQNVFNLKKILIIDWDLHHGNGTQHSFEEDPSILYFSTHQYPYYPGTGHHTEAGINNGEGFTINVPLSSGYGDAEYAGIFETLLKPVALEFKPDLILVSAGFDTYEKDPLGGMKVTPEGFAALTRSAMDMAATCCNGKLVLTLEGGYALDGLRDSVKAVLKELAGITHTDYQVLASSAHQRGMEVALNPVLDVHRRYWKNLA